VTGSGLYLSFFGLICEWLYGNKVFIKLPAPKLQKIHVTTARLGYNDQSVNAVQENNVYCSVESLRWVSSKYSSVAAYGKRSYH
jgi:hypothetical protein